MCSPTVVDKALNLAKLLSGVPGNSARRIGGHRPPRVVALKVFEQHVVTLDEVVEDRVVLHDFGVGGRRYRLEQVPSDGDVRRQGRISTDGRAPTVEGRG
jgi:hypothetical protein